MNKETISIITGLLTFSGGIFGSLIQQGAFFKTGAIIAIFGLLLFAAALFFLFSKKIFIKKTDFTKHCFFSTMAYYRASVIPSLKISHPLKRKMILKFLDLKFKIFQEKFSIYAKTNNESIEDFTALVCDCILEYESVARREGIPDLFLDKFRDFHRKHVEIAIHGLERIKNSNMLQNADKTIAAFNMLTSAFDLTILDAESSLNALNGELEKLLMRSNI